MALPTIVLTIDGIVINNNQVHGLITISRRENEASTMHITLITPTGIQDIDSWAGKTVLLDVGGVRAFTGVVDKPEIDVIYKKITLICNDKRREKLNTELAGTIGTIGFYSPAIFDDAENVIDELDQRLKTIPSAADIKPDGVYAITDMNPKPVPDFTLLDADIYRRQPSVSPTSRARLTNQVDLSFKYRYTRLRHRERGFKIEDLSFCDILDLGPLGSFHLKTTFQNYASMMNWDVNESSVTWEEMPPSGNTSPPCTVGLYYIHDDRFATSMFYDAAKRFGQTITEDFTLTVTAPQSIAQYGLINWAQDNGYSVEHDTGEWETDNGYQAPTGGTDDPNDYYIDQNGLISDFDDAVLTALNIANTKIITSHRDTQVNFETDLRVDFNLTHTIKLSTTPISAEGKITAINHIIDIGNRKGNTTTEISLSTAQGSVTPEPITVPARPLTPVIADAFIEPEIMLITDGNVVTPDIDDTSRNEQIAPQSVTYNIEIQNDNFEVTF